MSGSQVFNYSPLVSIIFDFLNVEDIFQCMTINKTCHTASKKYKEALYFICRCCHKLDKEVDTIFKICKKDLIFKSTFSELYEHILNMSFEYRCGGCQTRCKKCNTLKASHDLKHGLCQNGCYKHCDVCHKQLKKDMFRVSLKNTYYTELVKEEDFDQYIYLVMMDNWVKVSCAKCSHNFLMFKCESSSEEEELDDESFEELYGPLLRRDHNYKLH